MAVVRLLVRLLTCPFVRFVFPTYHGSAKLPWIFTKPSQNRKFGLLSCFKLFGPVHVPACTTAHEIVHAIFAYFYVSFFLTFWSISLLKMKKREATLQIGIDEAHLFHFIHFFPFQSGRPSKWPKRVKNVKKSAFFAKIWDLVIKVMKNKFPYIFYSIMVSHFLPIIFIIFVLK